MLRTGWVGPAVWFLLAAPLGGLAQARQLSDPNGAFSLEPPAGWDTTLTEGNAMVKHPTSGVGLMLAFSPKAVATPDDLAAAVIKALSSQAPDRKETGRERIQLCSFPTLLVRSQRTLMNVPVRDEMYAVLTPTRQFCLITQCPSTIAPAQGEAPLKAMLASLTIEGKPNKPAQPLLHPIWGTPLEPSPKEPSPKPDPEPKKPPFPTRALRDPRGVWTLSVPADWTSPDPPSSIIAQSPDKHGNITIFVSPGEPGTLQDFFQKMIPDLKKQCTKWTLISQQTLTVAGRDGFSARAESVIQGVEIHTDYILVQDERNLIVLTANCPKADFPDYQLKFGHIIASLQFLAAKPAPGPDGLGTIGPALK